MRTQISPMLAVTDGNAAIEFYRAAFGAEILWRLGDEHVVAGLSIDGAQFFLASESFVEDPIAVQQRAVKAGAVEHSSVLEHEHATEGPAPIKRMLQGAVVDPFGHLWLIGKILE
jgi:PhnB protein